MRFSRGLICAAACWLSFGAAISEATAAERHITLKIDQSGSGDGAQLAFLLKEKFRQSSLFIVQDGPGSGGYDLHLTTMAGEGLAKDLLVYSAIVTQPDIDDVLRGEKFVSKTYITDTIGYCGTRVLEACASNLYAQVGDWIDKRSQAAAESWARALEAATQKK
jgi:hypothetical protein